MRAERGMQQTEDSCRRRMNALLAETAACRPPALRRSLKPDWLYCTDLPRCASPEACRAFRARAEELGWETAPGEDWIQLRPAGAALKADWPAALPPGGEADCLRSLARRHPAWRLRREEEMLLLKALEISPEETESACRMIHGRWAERLRRQGRAGERTGG